METAIWEAKWLHETPRCVKTEREIYQPAIMHTTSKLSLARVRYNDEGSHARTWSAVTRFVRGMPLSVTPLWGGLSNVGGGRCMETMGIGGGGGGRCVIGWLAALNAGRPARIACVPVTEIMLGRTWFGSGGGGIPGIIWAGGGGMSVRTGKGISGTSDLLASPGCRCSELSWPIDFTGAIFWVSVKTKKESNCKNLLFYCILIIKSW